MGEDIAKKRTTLFFLVFIIIFSLFAFADHKHNVELKNEKIVESIKSNKELQYLVGNKFEVLNVDNSSENPDIKTATIMSGDMKFIVLVKDNKVLGLSYILHCMEVSKGKETCYTKLIYSVH